MQHLQHLVVACACVLHAHAFNHAQSVVEADHLTPKALLSPVDPRPSWWKQQKLPNASHPVRQPAWQQLPAVNAPNASRPLPKAAQPAAKLPVPQPAKATAALATGGNASGYYAKATAGAAKLTAGASKLPGLSHLIGESWLKKTAIDDKWGKHHAEQTDKLEKWLAKTGITSSGERMEWETHWMNYAFALPWTHLMWKYQMPLLNVMTPMMSAGWMTDFDYNYFDALDYYTGVFTTSKATGEFQAFYNHGHLMVSGPLHAQMRFHVRALWSMLRSHFGEGDDGWGYECLDLVGTNSGIMYPNGGGPYTEYMCATPMKCTSCLRAMYIAGMGGEVGSVTWGMHDGCSLERIALSTNILRSWLCSMKQLVLPIGPYTALLGLVGSESAVTAARTCYDLQKAAFAHNIYEDNSHIKNSYALGINCLVTLEMLTPYKANILALAHEEMPKLATTNDKDVLKLVRPRDALGIMRLFMYEFALPRDIFLEGFMCQDLSHVGNRFMWMNYFPWAGCSRYNPTFGTMYESRLTRHEQTQSKLIIGPGFHALVKEVKEVVGRLSPGLLSAVTAFELTVDKYYIVSVKDNMLLPSVDILQRLYEALDELVSKVMVKAPPVKHPEHSAEHKTQQQSAEKIVDAAQQLERDEDRHLYKVNITALRATRTYGLAALRLAMDTISLDSMAHVRRHLNDVIRPIIANTIHTLMGDTMGRFYMAMSDEGAFFELDGALEVRNISDILTIAFPQMTWYSKISMQQMQSKMAHLKKTWDDVAADNALPSWKAKNPFRHSKEMFDRLMPAMDKYNLFLRNKDLAYQRFLKYAVHSPKIDGDELYAPMKRTEVNDFLRQKTAEIQVTGKMRMMEERYSNLRFVQLERRKYTDLSASTLLDIDGQVSESEIVRSTLPDIMDAAEDMF